MEGLHRRVLFISLGNHILVRGIVREFYAYYPVWTLRFSAIPISVCVGRLSWTRKPSLRMKPPRLKSGSVVRTSRCWGERKSGKSHNLHAFIGWCGWPPLVFPYWHVFIYLIKHDYGFVLAKMSVWTILFGLCGCVVVFCVCLCIWLGFFSGVRIIPDWVIYKFVLCNFILLNHRGVVSVFFSTLVAFCFQSCKKTSLEDEVMSALHCQLFLPDISRKLWSDSYHILLHGDCLNRENASHIQCFLL